MIDRLTNKVQELTCRMVVDPVFRLLELGATPERLAWSLAAGLVIGINPLLGSTTVVCLLLAFTLRLNVLASQITQHLVAPLQIGLLFVFLDLGDAIFHTGKLPMTRAQLMHAMRHHPLTTTRELWTWQWHALAVWGVCSVIAAPLIAYALRPTLRCLLCKVHKRHQLKLEAAALAAAQHQG